jgi:hypothetical protein
VVSSYGSTRLANEYSPALPPLPPPPPPHASTTSCGKNSGKRVSPAAGASSQNAPGLQMWLLEPRGVPLRIRYFGHFRQHLSMAFWVLWRHFGHFRQHLSMAFWVLWRYFGHFRQQGYMDHTGCHRLVSLAIRPPRVVTPRGVYQIGYTDHTGCHQMVFDCKIFLVKSAEPRRCRVGAAR